jgi:hypothetical protein
MPTCTPQGHARDPFAVASRPCESSYPVGKFETCVDCQKRSPETDTDYTLIGAQHGWRLTRSKDAEGGLLLEWRCPTCWREFKHTKPETSSGVSRRSSKPPGLASERMLKASAPSAPAPPIKKPAAPPPGRGRPPK